MELLSDVAAERAVLGGICKYSGEAYFDVADILSERTFTLESNTAIYKCLKHILEQDQKATIDIPSIYSAAKDVGVEYMFKSKDQIQHLKAVYSMPVNLSTVRRLAGKIRKLEVTKLLHAQLGLAQDNLMKIRGDEPIASILGVAEDIIFDFSSLLNENEGPQKMFTDIESYLKQLADSPVDQMGISTGYPTLDYAIGGGLRDGTVNVIGARPKTGKTLLADNIGVHIAKNLNIPVLNLDTEMARNDHIHRIMAMLSEVEINDIETGKFASQENDFIKLHSIARDIKDVPYYYKSIAGSPFEEQLALIRRWIVKNVGLQPDGTAKRCAIIFDYLKLMSSEGISADLKEYQLLGFMMTGLHNFAVRYKIPILAFMQLNRDGITKESTDAASGSDRIIWLCSNFSIYKRKSDEEIMEGAEDGNRKMVPIISRHGGGLEDGDYINMYMQGKIGKITEGKTHFETLKKRGTAEQGFVQENNDDNPADLPFE